MLVGDGPQRSDVEAAIERLGLREHVRTLGHRTDVASLMQLADLYVHYATAENCPTVLLEAARAGLAIAAVPVGGIPEILEALGEAATLPPDDHDSSIARLAPFLTSSDLRAAAGRLAREVFNAQFDRERMAGAYADLICRLSATAAPAEGAS